MSSATPAARAPRQPPGLARRGGDGNGGGLDNDAVAPDTYAGTTRCGPPRVGARGRDRDRERHQLRARRRWRPSPPPTATPRPENASVIVPVRAPTARPRSSRRTCRPARWATRCSTDAHAAAARRGRRPASLALTHLPVVGRGDRANLGSVRGGTPRPRRGPFLAERGHVVALPLEAARVVRWGDRRQRLVRAVRRRAATASRARPTSRRARRRRAAAPAVRPLHCGAIELTAARRARAERRRRRDGTAQLPARRRAPVPLRAERARGARAVAQRDLIECEALRGRRGMVEPLVARTAWTAS